MRKSILIADKSQIFLISIGLLLKRLGFGVIPAENGIEVLKLAKLQEPHLIMLDVDLEEMDGIKALGYLKEDKLTSHIPIIMMSTDSSARKKEQCRNLGCVAYLLKPVRISELHAIIQDCFYSHKGTNRKHLRVTYNQKVSVTCSQIIYELASETLSAGGIYLRKQDPFPIGSKVELTLPLNKGDRLRLQGSVIYTKELFGDLFKLPPGMAVEFKGVSEDDYRTLRNYIEELLAGDIIEGREGDFITKDTGEKALPPRDIS
jgi:CheY-like chemotaxis protein